MNDFSLGEKFCWQKVLLDPAPPPRRAARRDPPVVCPGFTLDRSVLAICILLIACFDISRTNNESFVLVLKYILM